jgi:hypothetical protein
LANYAGAFGLKEVQFDTEIGVRTTVNDLRQFDPLSTRAIRIRPVTGKAKADITIAVAPAKGAIGTSVTGWVYRKPSATATWTSTVMQASNAIAGFGADSLDEVVVVLVNPTFDIGEFLVNCTITAAPAVLTVAPSTASLAAGATQAFTASLANSAVTWSVQEGSAGGTITTAGVYTAPAKAGTYHVLVTSKVDPSKTATATVTVKSGGSGTSISGTIPSMQLIYGANLWCSFCRGPILADTGLGNWSLTGTGVELLGVNNIPSVGGGIGASEIYIYAPRGSQGVLSITLAPAWDSTNPTDWKENWDFNTLKYLDAYTVTYHPLTVETYGTVSDGVAATVATEGLTQKISYTFGTDPNGVYTLQVEPAVGMFYDFSQYNNVTGALVKSTKNLGSNVNSGLTVYVRSYR